MSSGYTHCACRDCFEIVVSNDMAKPDYCDDCKDECGPENSTFAECQAQKAYGGVDED
jgi:hypothetical protein